MTDRAAARLLFEELVDLPAPDREERLRAEGARDPALTAAVRRLLAADDHAGGFLEGDAAAWAPELVRDLLVGEDAPGAADESGEVVGAWRLLSLLGRGGMGDVYLAARADGAFEQKAALKLLRRGIDSESIRARFLRERQVLAHLEHPNIARLLDGGAAAGRPYFVLEAVDGRPITEYCAARAVSLTSRVALLVTCCEAVDAAHRRLVVHRDIKPSNVLVTADGTVKLLDFGIAKVLSPDEEDSDRTRVDERVLTPAYAAPEQILGEPVTTATDVYALGVLAVQLLTGALPHDRRGVPAAGLAARLDAETAERPSRLALKSAAAAGYDPREAAHLPERLSGDLDAVLLKCLRREPERRYPSAALLAEELRRVLEGRPVTARPDTLGYRTGKFVRRHRAMVGATSLVFLALVAGLAGTSWQAKKAREAAAEASAQARRASRVKEFLVSLFEVADPEQSAGQTLTAAQVLDEGARRLQTGLANEPEVQAELLETVARIDRSLGRLAPSRALAEKALAIRRKKFAPDHAAVGSSLATLGSVLTGEGKLDEAEKKLDAALKILEAREGPDSLTTARARSDWAQVLFWKGRVADAEAAERRVWEAYRRELGDSDPLTAIHLRNLGVLLEELDRLDEAESAYTRSEAVLERSLGSEHPTLGQSYLNRAVLLERRSRFEEADRLFRRSLEVRRATLGPAHVATGQSLQLYALFCLNQGRLDESEPYYKAALAIFRGVDPKHFEVGKCTNGLALIASRRGDHARAEALLLEVVALFREVLGEKHAFVWQSTSNLAEQVALQGRLAEAETLQRAAVAKLEEILGPDGRETAEARSRLGAILRGRGRLDESESELRRALATQTKLHGAGSLPVALTRYELGATLAKKPGGAPRAEARALLGDSAATYRRLKPDHPRLPAVEKELELASR